MMPRRVLSVVMILMCGVRAGCAFGQAVASPCGVGPVVSASSQPNIFSAQQEQWLGDVEADQVESGVKPVRDASLSQHLQDIAERLLRVLPPTNLHFRVTLIDGEEVNAFSLAGGHIYVLRKLAAVAQSDDELAAVLGHEIGHIISHQFAFETTADLNRLLHVTSVGDEADIRSKFSALLDAELVDKHPALEETDKEQEEADRIGLYAMSAAGYKPSAFAEFWNRTLFVKGKTGSRLGDLLGLTKPDQKRLRSMQKMIADLPAGCGSTGVDESGFASWHAAVLANQRGVSTASVVALKEVKLSPPLTMGLQQLRFSPDGKSLLAQDDGSIFVLSRTPLAVRYRIDADNAMPANFSPDSRSITFSTPGLRTEQWSTTEKKLQEAHEMLTGKTCYDPRLAPDGRTLICLGMDEDSGEVGLSMVDTSSSQVVWEKKSWFFASYAMYLSLQWAHETAEPSTLLPSSYSADNRELLIGGGDHKLGLDLTSRTATKIGDNLLSDITGGYAFIGSDLVAGANALEMKNSSILHFPDGKRVTKVALPESGEHTLTNPGMGRYVLLSGLKDYEAGVVDLTAGKVVLGLKTRGLDVFDGAVAGESASGAVILTSLNKDDKTQDQRLELPESPLAGLRGVAISDDGKYLALSTRSRGAMWDLSTGKQVGLMHPFTDAAWKADDTLYLDVAKHADVERHIAEVTMTGPSLKALPYKVDDATHMRYGRLTVWKEDAKKKAWTFELHDPETNAVVWSRIFPDAHFAGTASYGDRDLIFVFPMKSNTAKAVLSAKPELAAELAAAKKDSAELIEVLDGRSGMPVGDAVVDLPVNHDGVDGMNRAGDSLYVETRDDRTIVYSMKTGKKVRDLIGYVRAVDPGSAQVCLANRLGEANVFDSEGVRVAHFELGEPIRYARFLAGGKELMVLTADQTVRTLDVAVK